MFRNFLMIRLQSLMVRAKQDPEDADSDVEDHAWDCLQYLLAARPRPSVGAEPVPKLDPKLMGGRYMRAQKLKDRKL